MSELAWNWLCLPYLACAASLAAVALVAALIRGDNVLRLGTVGAATTALPWALCSAVSTCTQDPQLAARLLRLGNGPVALVGPSLLLVLLGVSGQLERNKWLARTAGLVGLAFTVVCWSTTWVIDGVHRLPSGILYTDPGLISGIFYSMIGIWLMFGVLVVRRTTIGLERRRIVRMLLGVLALGTIGASDLLLAYDIAGVFPLAWLCATIAAIVALYYELKTDLLRPQGWDRNVFIEAAGFAVAMIVITGIVYLVDARTPVALAAGGSLVWVCALGITWAARSERPVRVARERALEQFLATIGDVDLEGKIAERLAALWLPVRIEVRRTWRVEHGLGGDELVEIASPTTRRRIERDVATWLVDHNEALASVDLGTMRLGKMRAALESLVAEHRATLIVPLIDRGTLVGIVDADHQAALREDERGLVAESARAAARALTYLGLARSAARERETAREVEVAEAMRLQAAASRDDELGRWSVIGEYRTAVRTTGAAWTATLLADGKLALLVTEAQAHGVAAALATSALTGAFAAATISIAAPEPPPPNPPPESSETPRPERRRPRAEGPPIGLDDLLTSLRASAEGVVRGGEPVAAFVAILDPDDQSIAWACAGHPGASLVQLQEAMFSTGSVSGIRAPVQLLGGGGARLGASMSVATRGVTKLPPDAMVVIASSQLRGDDDGAWQALVREHAAAPSRLASILVDHALKAGAPAEDLLAVVVRQRPDRRSEPLVMRGIG